MAAQRVAEGGALFDVCLHVAQADWKIMLSCWLARMSRHCTSGRPASIIVANWRVKMTMSLGPTRSEPNEKPDGLRLRDLDGVQLLLLQASLDSGLAIGFHHPFAQFARCAISLPRQNQPSVLCGPPAGRFSGALPAMR